MTTHELKTWPEPFASIIDGSKTFEIRRADRPFKVGDRLLLREYEPIETEWAPIDTSYRTDSFAGSPPSRISYVHAPHYTGRSLLVEVTYLTPGGAWGLPPAVCVMAIRKVEEVQP